MQGTHFYISLPVFSSLLKSPRAQHKSVDFRFKTLKPKSTVSECKKKNHETAHFSIFIVIVYSSRNAIVQKGLSVKHIVSTENKIALVGAWQNLCSTQVLNAVLYFRAISTMHSFIVVHTSLLVAYVWCGRTCINANKNECNTRINFPVTKVCKKCVPWMIFYLFWGSIERERAMY